MASASQKDAPSGVLLLHGDVRTVTGWVRRGIVPSYVVPLAGWTAVVAGGPARARAPYDDRHVVSAVRPVSPRLRAALGFFEIDGKALVVVHPRGWRALPRWLAWEAGRGVSRFPSTPPARPGDLAMAAGVVPEADRALRDILNERSALPSDVLADLMTTLALPGADLLQRGAAKAADGATLVEPDDRSVERFARVTAEDKAIRAEMEEM